MNDKMLSIPVVCERLGVSKSTLAQWRVEKKNLAYYKLGGRVMYREEDINEFLKGKKVEVKE